MRRRSADVRRRGWPVLVVAAALGVGVGVVLPGLETSQATAQDRAVVAAALSAQECSHAWVDAVDALEPAVIRHLDFAPAGPLPGDAPAPGLLVCDPTGAVLLGGGREEHLTDPLGALPASSAVTVSAWVRIDNRWTPGDLLWLTGPDGGVGLRVARGQLEVVVVDTAGSAAGTGTARVAATVAAPDSARHLITLTHAGGILRLWVDTQEVAAVVPAPPSVDRATLVVGAPEGSGHDAARAMVDEVLVLGATVHQDDLSRLVAANTW